MTKTYWLVESRYYDDGTFSAHPAGFIQAEERPGNKKVSTSEADIYHDWFDSRVAADRLVEAVRESEPVLLPSPA